MMAEPPPEPTNAEARKQLEGDVAEHIDTLLATVDTLNDITDLTNAAINQNAAAVIKDVTRELKTVTRQTIRLARLVVGVFDTADAGEDPPPPEE